MFIYEYYRKMDKILDDNSDKRICVLGTSCSGKSTYLNHYQNGLDMDEVIFPLLSEEEIKSVTKTPWTEEIGAIMSRFVKEKIKIAPGKPVFSTVLIDCDLIVYMNISDELLRERCKKRNVDFENAKNLKLSIERELTGTGIPVINVDMSE